ncbi:MAG: ABC transporter ATP-binding protein [Boseongicola sp. SB0665_bin_10]|nr:ABC transporter ATP-binding protein [Boseongicola sp. SB0665_bin_10]
MRILLEKFTKSFGSLTVIDEMDLEIDDGEMVALLGPSGCGKSTTLFAICGIHRVSGGRILFGDRDVSSVPSQQRNVGVVFQSYALYPHLTVAQNIGFPLMIRKESNADIARKVDEIAELVHIGNLLERRPAQLSGGQQQRVALARALVRKPDVLLLDEPLANLDAKLRLEMRSEIRRIQRETGITAVLVTHDQVEAMSMCDRIAIMNEGRIVQIAEPMEMYDNPASDFVAGFLGNPPIAFVDGVVTNGRFATASGAMTVSLPFNAGERERKIRLGIRPEFFRPGGTQPVAGKITFVEAQGRETLYDVALEDGQILRSIQTATNAATVGEKVNWGIDVERILMFDEDGARL